jgi:hypothetical protein
MQMDSKYNSVPLVLVWTHQTSQNGMLKCDQCDALVVLLSIDVIKHPYLFY